MVTKGSVGPIDVVALKASAGSTNVYKFNADFHFVFRGSSTGFRHGGIYALHAELKAALIASAAPMTQL